jgi:peptide/nickel transport system permease protein
LAPVDPTRLAMRQKFLPPGAEHWFGTDNFGRSLWSRVIWGARLSVLMGTAVVVLNAVFGTLIGALAGYFRRLDNAVMRVNDALMAFPAILLAIGITAVLGPSTADAVLALAIVYIPRTARIVRASVIVLREMEYVQAAMAAGAGHWRVIKRHIMPNALAPLIVQLSFLFAYAVLSEATLSFLGLGAVPPTPTWGNIMAEGRQYMTDAPWIITIPGIWLMITVLGLNMLGDGLRDVLDPRLRIQQ